MTACETPRTRPKNPSPAIERRQGTPSGPKRGKSAQISCLSEYVIVIVRRSNNSKLREQYQIPRHKSITTSQIRYGRSASCKLTTKTKESQHRKSSRSACGFARGPGRSKRLARRAASRVGRVRAEKAPRHPANPPDPVGDALLRPADPQGDLPLRHAARKGIDDLPIQPVQPVRLL